jgi:hypothetical protein
VLSHHFAARCVIGILDRSFNDGSRVERQGDGQSFDISHILSPVESDRHTSSQV